MQSNSEELIERIAAPVPTDGTIEAFPGFRLSRASSPTEPVQAVYEPSFCFVAQGSKKALLGAEMFRYNPRHYLIFTVDLPVTFQVEEAIRSLSLLRLTIGPFPASVQPTLLNSTNKKKRQYRVGDSLENLQRNRRNEIFS